ncbi:glycoside hydrolase family 95 protein [Echinicola strongylocentroti]|uniref:Glycoside hydrolase family 95 protein n=1 Tax=Echinicola strongylocentroti TaxID=1795355 RepID=A0A2Z4IR59_9BACT|nr:glycoside hydrolase family 95 protein [Echinicola strongylocentroti]AWW32783.1 glycoside hydrolase family 95 protein [Echinicola strongylocentroti]
MKNQWITNFKHCFPIIIALIGLQNVCFGQGNQEGENVKSDRRLSLWYEQPATEWTKALPIGNGRLGAMVYGGIQMEHLQLNEETLWNGGPHSYDNPEAYQYLKEVRGLLEQGEYIQAEDTAQKMLGSPSKQMAYQPFGDLFLMFPQGEKAKNYRHELDLASAVSTVSYDIGPTHYTRKVFASHPDESIVMRVEGEGEGQVTFDLLLTSPHPSSTSVDEHGLLVMKGQLGPREERGLIGPWEGEGIEFAAKVKVLAEGGEVVSQGEKISVRDADAVTLVYVAATSFESYDDVSGDPVQKVNDDLSAVDGKSYDDLYQRHIKEYSEVFNRVSIDLGGPEEGDDVPTDQRLHKVIDGGTDPLLAEKIFQYGRYLMIAGSRPGSQPLNLQGIWNGTINPPWASKYTININIQMNYWVAEVCNLSEFHEPLLNMVDELQGPGSTTAEVHYRANGWVTHHNTDLWRGTAPVDGAQWGMWPMGGAWLCQHLWEHYLYTGDREFLKKAYPIMKGAATFFFDALVENEEGYLITSPSISPEHSHGGTTADGLSVGRDGTSLCAGPTMDTQILNDLFANCVRASEILGEDKKFRHQVERTRARLAPMKVGRYGQLQEWQSDWDNPDDPHSHVSHLYGLYPSSQINPSKTPVLFDAARTSLIQRGFNDGWPGAWRISLWARVGDGNNAHKSLNDYVIPGLSESLLNNGRVFQIDANFGATAGIAEMLLQSHDGAVNLLPALPDVWDKGKVEGLQARGGFVIESMTWKDGQLEEAVIKSTLGGNCRVKASNELVLASGQSLKLAKGNNKNEFYQIPAIKEPVIADRSALQGYSVPETTAYDIPTEKGEIIRLERK